MKKKREKYYALFTTDGKLITYDPATDTYSVIPKRYDRLKIWDYQTFSDEATWFMGNSKKPHINFEIKEIKSTFIYEKISGIRMGD